MCKIVYHNSNLNVLDILKLYYNGIVCYEMLSDSILIIMYLLLLIGKAIRLWFLCTSDTRSASSKVTGGHSLLDGTRGHRKAGIWDSGTCIVLCQNV